MSDPAPLLPNLVIAGVPKAGTSSIHAWLSAHPDCAGATGKETYFLVDPGTHMYSPDNHVSNGLDGYAAHFPGTAATAQIRCDATPSYVYSATAKAALANMPGAPRVLFILREPAAQIYSLYRYFKNNWDWIDNGMSFADFVQACRDGTEDFKGNELARDCLSNAIYVDHLADWREILGSDRMRVILFDELQSDPAQVMRSLCAWLGIDPGFFDDFSFTSENETYQPRSRGLQALNIAVRGSLPKGRIYAALRGLYRRLNTRAPDSASAQDRATLAALQAEFAPHNARLAKAFDLDLSGWPRD